MIEAVALLDGLSVLLVHVDGHLWMVWRLLHGWRVTGLAGGLAVVC